MENSVCVAVAASSLSEESASTLWNNSKSMRRRRGAVLVFSASLLILLSWAICRNLFVRDELEEDNFQADQLNEDAFQMLGVQYVPHYIGDPAQAATDKRNDVYTASRSAAHERDMKIIHGLGANTIRLRSWQPRNFKTIHQSQKHDKFLEAVKKQKMRIIPTFNLAGYYEETLKANSPPAKWQGTFKKGFEEFIQSLEEVHNIAAWSIDLSLDMDELYMEIKETSGEQKCGERPDFKSFSIYIQQVRWLVQLAGESNSFKDKPLLLPLDVSRLPSPGAEVSQKKVSKLVRCLTSGEWATPNNPGDDPLKLSTGKASQTQFLFSFAIPVSMDSDTAPDLLKSSFKDFLSGENSLLQAHEHLRAVVMVSAPAVRFQNETWTTVEELGVGAMQQTTLKQARLEYNQVQQKNPKLKGFLVDEWSDDWDRGANGPFFIAQSSGLARGVCSGNSPSGRFVHDQCSQSWPYAKDGAHRFAIYPEFSGIAANIDRLSQHCVSLRLNIRLFSDFKEVDKNLVGLICVFNNASTHWFALPALGFATVFLLLMGRQCRDMLRGNGGTADLREQPSPTAAPSGDSTLVESRLQICLDLDGGRPMGGLQFRVKVVKHGEFQTGSFYFQFKTRRLTQNDAEWWFACHSEEQLRIVEEQLKTEFQGVEASMQRCPRPDAETSILLQAVKNVHRRCLEGFLAWCEYISKEPPSNMDRASLVRYAERIRGNGSQDADMKELLVEVLLLRVMESLGEHILQCPERLAYLLYKVLQTRVENTYAIDYEELQKGLDQMNEHADPYTHKNGQLGINFDDINECGIQCRDDVVKTFREPRSVMVILDFILSYRVMFLAKLWGFMLAGYLYLGVGTEKNGTFFGPKDMRVKMMLWAAFVDAVLWTVLELLLSCNMLRSRSISWGHRSPGVPGMRWYVCRAMLVLLAGGAAFLTNGVRVRTSKDVPWYGDHMSQPLFAVVYFVIRGVIFLVSHFRVHPMHLWGRPWTQKVPVQSWQDWSRVALIWASMLLFCVCLEAYVYLPLTKGLDWQTQCGLDVFSVLPHKDGVCSAQAYKFSTSCLSCGAAVVVVWAMVTLSSFVDIYFIFYIWSSVGGLIIGEVRKLNDSRNVHSPIGSEQWKHVERTLGPKWKMIWESMIDGLRREALITPRQAKHLETVARAVEGAEPDVTLNLRLFGTLAGERLAFWFKSMPMVEKLGLPGKASNNFLPDFDAITSVNFNPGSIPSITMVIPAYNEIVIPSLEFLTNGSLAEHAQNQDDGQGNLINPPLGDGINTNLKFMISQFPHEWDCLALQLEGANSEEEHVDMEKLARKWYQRFLQEVARHKIGQCSSGGDLLMKVRWWAAYRMQSVAKTVLGALQYANALEVLSTINRAKWEADDRDHVEVILAHQTYGQPSPVGRPENDEAVRLLLKENMGKPLFLVFDLEPDSNDDVWEMVDAHLGERYSDQKRNGMRMRDFHASIKCGWDQASDQLKVLSVLPRQHKLRLGKGEYRTQGKASNQLSALRFATGHNLQALDCNMGVFIGEAFKVPYALREFMPPDVCPQDRHEAKCRYLGFREFVFTGREGRVGFCHSAAEWSFGTIYQRFLESLHQRMHYGHPDIVDGFFARNRGGMSKCSPVVNLSEDIFGGYNVRMREDRNPHTDAIEFEKGRESTFQSASNFFSKISGGAVAVLRSRDNRLICENIGVLNGLSFYFTSVAFYVSNLLIDITIYMYMVLFILLTLSAISVGTLKDLGTALGVEWVFSMGLVSIIPQLLETTLEYGFVRGLYDTIFNVPAAAFFFVFQNKNVASSLRTGAVTGMAKYFFTGRPIANQHQTWRDIYNTYWKSHYHPAFQLASFLAVYKLLASQNNVGQLPMFLGSFAFICWLTAPIVFSPFPKGHLLRDDAREFGAYILSKSGMQATELPEAIKRADRGKFKSVYEAGVTDEISTWVGRPWWVIVSFVSGRLFLCLCCALVFPSIIFDYMLIWVWTYDIQIVLLFMVLMVPGLLLSNILMLLSIAGWCSALVFGVYIIGSDANTPTLSHRMVEICISFLLYVYFLGAARYLAYSFTILHWNLRSLCISRDRADKGLRESLALWYVFSCKYHLDVLRALVVLCTNVLVTCICMVIDFLTARCFGVALHTWWLLNRTIASRTDTVSRVLEAQGEHEISVRDHAEPLLVQS